MKQDSRVGVALSVQTKVRMAREEATSAERWPLKMCR
jgi:hypothetical protein